MTSVLSDVAPHIHLLFSGQATSVVETYPCIGVQDGGVHVLQMYKFHDSQVVLQ